MSARTVTNTGILVSLVSLGLLVLLPSCGGGGQKPIEPLPPPPVTSVEVFPPSEVLGPNGTRIFNATVHGSFSGVTWSVQEGAAGGSISDQRPVHSSN